MNPQLISIVCVIISVSTAIAIAYVVNWRLKRKRMSYEILAYFPLLTANETIRNELQVLYQGMPVKDIRLLNLKIINSGYEPITRSDYEKPIDIIFSEESKVLSAHIAITEPENLEVSVNFDSNRISISPTLLNSKDFIEVNTIVSSYEDQTSIDARIVGVKEIKPIEPRIIRSIYASYGSIVLLCLVGVVFTFFMEFPINYILLAIITITICSIIFEANYTVKKFRQLAERGKLKVKALQRKQP